MGSDEFRRGQYDPLVALRNAGQLMGMDLKPCGPGRLCGPYYLDGSMHAWRRDKIKVYIWKGGVFVSEEGGHTLSLPNWLIQYGGAADWKDAIRIINGQPQNIVWNREFREKISVQKRYVTRDALVGAKAYDLNLSPLFRHMCSLFGEEKTRKVWEEYCVTANSKGGTVFWYLNPNGDICHDKIVWYGEDGHRNRSLPMGRTYKMADGYTEKPLFGSHLQGNVNGILESEKSCLYAACYYGGVWLATGGLNALRDVAGVPLYPDRDGEKQWSQYGDCVDWYSDWPECGDHSDLGDKIEWLVKNGKYELYLESSAGGPAL